jgi:hypothetical protein
MIKDFRALLDNTQDATHHLTLYNGTQRLVKLKSRNKTYMSDKQLHAMELHTFHGIKVEVEGFEDEHISEICQCTGSWSWHGGDRFND